VLRESLTRDQPDFTAVKTRPTLPYELNRRHLKRSVYIAPTSGVFIVSRATLFTLQRHSTADRSLALHPLHSSQLDHIVFVRTAKPPTNCHQFTSTRNCLTTQS
jgi:hypothetical protein